MDAPDIIPPNMDIPRDKSYPSDAGQCDCCGGHGCAICGLRGWLPAWHEKIRKCLFCEKPLPPDHVAVYCTNACAFADAR